MRRTTIFLPEEVHQRLRREAFEARVSMAQVIRTRLESGGRSRRSSRTSDPLAKVEGLIRDGHLSQGIDEALYGK